jgi:hypothetical protein
VASALPFDVAPAIFVLVIFQKGLMFLPGARLRLRFSYLGLPVAGIMNVNHHAQFVG